MAKNTTPLIDPDTGELLAESRSRVWSCIIYPNDSAPDNWQEILESFIVPIAVSPLHTKELLSTGEYEKDHRHVIINFCGEKSQAQVKKLIAPLKGTIPIPVADIRAMTRYLIHLDQPNKKSYDKSEILTFCGYDLETCLLPSKGYMLKLLQAIETFIDTHGITEYAELCLIARETEPAWYDIIVNQKTNHIKLYINSRRNQKQQGTIYLKKIDELSEKINELENYIKEKEL